MFFLDFKFIYSKRHTTYFFIAFEKLYIPVADYLIIRLILRCVDLTLFDYIIPREIKRPKGGV